MKMPNSKPLLLRISGFLLLLVLEIGVLSVSGWRLAVEKKEVGRQYKRLSVLQNRVPYPSAESVEVLGENLDELEYRVQALAAELGGDPFPDEVVEAAEFSAMAQGMVERFRKRTKGAGISLQDSLEAGFSDYVSGGSIPAARNVPRLVRQLHSVECVLRTLLQEGVISIDRIDRDRFEQGSGEVAASRRDPRRGSADALSALPKDVIASRIGPDGLYLVEEVRVSFTADEQAVWRIMHSIAKAPHFMVVSAFSHATKTRLLDYDPEVVKAGSEDETMRFLAEGILTGKGALSRPERIVAGNDPIQVDWVVDVYNFRPVGESE